MKLYLARKKNGLYVLTKLEPILTNIVHTDYLEIFVRPGDPINFQGLCPYSVRALFGTELEPGEIVRVELTAEKLPSRVQASSLAAPSQAGSGHADC
jgi:hypothetical protein